MYVGTSADVPVKGNEQALLTPYKMGAFELSNRMVYAPLTRCRAMGNIPQPSAITYYTQRAYKGGLMLSEGTSPSPTGYGYALHCRHFALLKVHIFTVSSHRESLLKRC